MLHCKEAASSAGRTRPRCSAVSSENHTWLPWSPLRHSPVWAAGHPGLWWDLARGLCCREVMGVWVLWAWGCPLPSAYPGFLECASTTKSLHLLTPHRAPSAWAVWPLSWWISSLPPWLPYFSSSLRVLASGGHGSPHSHPITASPGPQILHHVPVIAWPVVHLSWCSP